MRKKILCLLLVLAMIVPFAACGSSSSSDVDATNAIKIGGIGPITGAAAIYGEATKNGAQLAVDEINALGGTQYVLNWQDDEHDAEKSVNAYNQLKDWGMQVLVGTTTTAPSIAVSSEAKNDSIFMLTPSASSTEVTEGKTNVFQMCFADPNQGSASATYISENKLGTKVGVIYNSDDAYSSGIYATFMTKAKELGLNVVAEEAFTTDSSTDFSAQLKSVKDAGADLLFLPIYYTPASVIMKQAKDMDYSPKYFGVDGMDGILTLEGFDTSLAEGVMLLTPFAADATDEATKNFVASYKEKYGEVPNQFAADAYDCVYAIAAAIEKDGTITPTTDAKTACAALVKVFTSSDFTFDGLTGSGMTWKTDGSVNKDPKAVVIQDGAYVLYK